MLQRFRTPLLALVAIVVLVVLTLIVLPVDRTPPRPPLPNPNGYDDFLKAATLLTGDLGNASVLDHDALRALVSTNAETLRLLRLGLSRDCSVPTDSAMTNIDGVLPDLANLKSLVRLLAQEGRLAEMDGRLADAALSYLDAIRFGNEISRGGFIIHRLVGIACEAIGESPLAKLVPKLKRDEARSVLTALEKIDSVGITWDEVWQNEKRFAQYHLRKNFNPITRAISRWQAGRQTSGAEMRHNRIVAHVRLLTAELGVRCYQGDQGHVPTRLDELVPKYFAKVPQDPFSRHPLVYRPQGTNWLLYSVGEDGVDDGGKPMGRSGSGTVPKGDMFYDSPY